jgi:hypothetical protein
MGGGLPKRQELEPMLQEMAAKPQELEPKCQEWEPMYHELEPNLQESEPIFRSWTLRLRIWRLCFKR